MGVLECNNEKNHIIVKSLSRKIEKAGKTLKSRKIEKEGQTSKVNRKNYNQIEKAGLTSKSRKIEKAGQTSKVRRKNYYCFSQGLDRQLKSRKKEECKKK